MNTCKYGIYKRLLKRPVDFLLSLTVIILLSPIFLFLALLIRTKLGSPVLFKQERPGLNEETFMMYKFRTMTDERDNTGKLLTDNLRLTKFGNFLRSTSLDELPELLNILKGDMSIVGPRPLVVEYLPYYTKEERQRHNMRPGLTGLAQVEGRSFLSWEQRFSLDIQYVKKCNFILDISIIFKTVIQVLKSNNVADVEKVKVDDKGEYFIYEGRTFRRLNEERSEQNVK